jgi:anti-sigma B factor antagonist
MEINIAQQNTIYIVELAGDLNSNTSDIVKEQIAPLLTAGQNMVLDMSRVAFMSSAGLRVLLLLQRSIGDVGGKVVLVGLSERLESIMSMTGFLSFFEVAPNRETALNLLQA